MDAVVIDRQHLAGLHVAHEGRAHRVQRGALGGDRPANGASLGGREATQGQRAESDRVARRDQRALGEHGEGVGAHRTVEGVLDALRPAAPR